MKKIRYGIIGFGSFAERAILPAIGLSQNSEVVAIQKRDPAVAAAKAAQYGVPHAFGTAEELAACPEVDAVFIVTANASHCTDTLAAARAGKHVLVEKPMAMSADEAVRMMEACRSKGVTLAVGHMLRFSPLLQRMKEIIASGEAGEITSVRSEFVYDAGISKRAWLFDRRSAGGGPTFDIGVHCLDSLRFVLGDEVASTMARLTPMPTEARTESTSLLSLAFERGTLGTIYTSFETPIRRSFIEFVGRKAVISAGDFTTGDSQPTLRVIHGTDGKAVRTVEEHIAVPNLYEREVTHVSECILAGRTPLIDGENGLRNQIVLEDAYRQ